MVAASATQARSQLARHRVLRRQANAAVVLVAALVAGGTYKYGIARMAQENRALALAVSIGVVALIVVVAIARRRSPSYRAREEAGLQRTLEELRAAAPALTPAERQRELDRLSSSGASKAVLEELRELLESQPGGMRPLPALCVKDPDDPFRASRGLVARALAGYPLAAGLGGAVVAAISEAGFEPVEVLGVILLVLPGFLTWRDRDAQDAQPGERFAWSLASVFAFIVWVAALIVVVELVA
jgi:hypothetical protein